MNGGCTYKQIVLRGKMIWKYKKKFGQGEGILKIRDLGQG
jgi:hypothetical protein